MNTNSFTVSGCQFHNSRQIQTVLNTHTGSQTLTFLFLSNQTAVLVYIIVAESDSCISDFLTFKEKEKTL